MKTERDQALDLLRALPEDATFVDVMYELDALRRRLRGIDERPEGHDAGKEEVVSRLRKRIMLTGAP